MRLGNVLVVSAMVLACSVAVFAADAPPASDIKYLRGHTEAVFCTAISRDGKLIASGSKDTTAIIWNAQTGQKLHLLEGHKQTVTAVGFSADGSRVVTASLDQTARVWDAKNGSLIAVLQSAHANHIHGAAISPDGKRVLTASCDATVVMWDVDREKVVQRFPQAGEADAVAFSPDGGMFATGCRFDGRERQKTLNLYNTKSGDLLEGFDLSMVKGIEFSHDGSRLLAIDGFGSLHALYLSARRLEPEHENKRIATMSISWDGKLLLMGSEKEAILVNLKQENRLLGTFKMDEEIRAVTVSPDGKWCVVAGGGEGTPWGNQDYVKGRDFTVKLMSLPVGEELGGAFTVPRTPMLRDGPLVVSGDRQHLLAYSIGGPAIWWNAETHKQGGWVYGGLGWFSGAMSGDGSRAALACTSSVVLVCNAEQEILYSIHEPGFQPLSLAFDKKGQNLFVGGSGSAERERAADRGDKTPAKASKVYLYNVATNRIMKRYRGPAGPLFKILLSPDEKLLLGLSAMNSDGELAAVVWDVEKEKQLSIWKPAQTPAKLMPITAPAWSADSRTAAFAYNDVVVVIEPTTGKVIAELKGHTSAVRQIAFDPDGKRLWSSADKDSVRIWDWAGGKELGKTEGAAKYGTFRFDNGRHELITVEGTKLVWHDLDRRN